MLKLSLKIVLFLTVLSGFAQSPHGNGFKIDCASCHNADTWKVTKSDMSFDHNSTQFKLTGQHQAVDCKSCHQTLKFQDAKSQCTACHIDMHSNTLGPDCARCHNTKAWIIENTKTMHQLSRFPLEGNHAVVDCASCHKSASNLKFEPLGVECIDCHKKDYLETKSPNHQQSRFSTSCTDCHVAKSVGWKNANFDHSSFPLTGGHNVSCILCHTSGTYQKLSTECSSCHQVKYNSAQVPSHMAAGISTDCKICHTATDWKPSTFNHTSTGFSLTGAHATVVQCSSCHKGNTTSAKPECISCHQTQYNTAPGHLASKFSTDCLQCHNNNNWLNATFDHNTTNFPLTGAHKTVTCASCHTAGYTGTSMECKSCHQAKFNSAQVPSHTAAGISTDCKTCHTATDWKPSTFNHTSTGFSLAGAHASIVQCSVCHKGNTSSAQPECISCHQTQYNTAPGHIASNFPTDCKICHNSNNWLNATFDHSKNGFPLSGAHTTTACASCHTSGVYTGLSTECKSCHQTKYNSAQVPSHTAAGISTDCKTCHTATDWKPSTFNHTSTGFSLAGAHASIVQCSVCHKGNTSSAQPECISCHQTQYNTAPGHLASKFSTNCIQCHNSNDWLKATFDHSKNGFPLSGAHSTTACASCHTSGVYTGLSPECKSCHQAKYNSAQVPSHTAAGISADCKTCHTATDWKPSTFNHTSTGFSLAGAHASIVQCSVCHKGNTSSAQPECISCHQSQYNAAPGHLASNFPTDCRMCHSSNNWLNASFDHSKNGFPLSGAHSTTACASCHTSGVYTGLSPECKSCHQAKYNSAQVPSHTAAGISTDCKTCHTATDWKPSTFNHTSTGFSLAGAHASVVQCSSCHKGNTTSAQPECISCHQSQYNAAPGHLASNFPTDCRMCHSSNNWLNASFDHSKNGFPLSGAHSTTACASCHTSGVYTGLSPECKSCHQAKYNSAQVPSHIAAGISTDCKTCHTATDWKPSTFNHTSTGFTLTGAHASVVQCSSCHKGNTTSAQPECISCHQSQYNAAPGHLASSFPTDCKICHSSNNWLNASFDHSKNGFPLTGAHSTTACASCHTSGVYKGLSTECKSCHQAKYNSAQVPSHTAAGISTDCKTCHTATDWKPSTFNHTSTGFSLTGAHATLVQCSSCHKGNTTSAQPECISCHQSQYNTAPGHLASNFPTDCKICHSSNNWLNASFDHSKNGFPLTGAHSTTACASCHTSGVYTGLSPECKSCHQAKYNSAQVPSHTAAGISTDCKTCHTATNWKPSTFNHTSTGFSLTGAHATVVQCSSCHKGNTTSAKTTCISCHQTQYNAAPGHLTSNFSTDCTICHTVNAWKPSTFNHTNYFPITSSRHNVSCVTCHTNTSNYTIFTCLTAACHTNAHNRSQGSTGCYRCHPTGRGD
jgi:hypothetical protein